MRFPLLTPLAAFLGRLRHPTLFKLTLALTLLSWLLPDPLPFVDELLGLTATLWLSQWRKARADSAAPG